MNGKKAILALGPAGSNGHEAALKAAKLIEPSAEWQVNFCDSNSDVLTVAITYGLYAVVPVENSTAGPVKTIADSLFRTCGRDSKARVIGEIALPIEHCLLARQDWHSGSPSAIVSHPQALAQCGRFLEKNGWSGLTKPMPSTSGAARLISTDPESAEMLAIASKLAAETYGLRVISQGIQDAADNVTRFAILAPANEPALMADSLRGVSVAIVGADGGYGRWLKAFFEHHGCKVLSVDTDTPAERAGASVAQASVVIFSVPTLETPKIMKSFVPVSRPDQLWLDVTSLKVEAVKAMMGSKAEVVGLHPLCAPPRLLSLKGQSLAVCAERLNKWGPWLASFLALLEADIDITDPATHDHLVAERQGLPHALMFIEAAVMRSLGVNVKESLRVASPFYKLLLAAVCRMHRQNPHVYAGIQMGNPDIPKILRSLRSEVDRLIEIVDKQDDREFIRLFNEHREHIGVETLGKGNEDFEFMIALLADLSARNAITIQLDKDAPGILAKITSIISSQGVNMTSMHTQPINGGGVRFVIGLNLPVNSNEVHAIIKEINSTGSMKVI